jgi:hypothetical protein
MRVLLLSMPDSFEHMPSLAIRMPCGALSSLAGNVDPHHEVAVADLVLVQDRVRETVLRLLAERAPDVVGLSVMSFQRATARKLIALVREMGEATFYEILGIDAVASALQLHEGFERTARLVHPDNASRLGYSGRDPPGSSRGAGSGVDQPVVDPRRAEQPPAKQLPPLSLPLIRPSLVAIL